MWLPKYFQIFLLLNATIHLIFSHYFSVISFFNVVKFKVSSRILHPKKFEFKLQMIFLYRMMSVLEEVTGMEHVIPLKNVPIEVEPLRDLAQKVSESVVSVSINKTFCKSCTYSQIYITLCSRNFQNVKLRLDFVEIWSFFPPLRFYVKSNFANSNSPKMSFWQF